MSDDGASRVARDLHDDLESRESTQSQSKRGFVSHALKYGDAIAASQFLAAAKSLGDMRRIVFNDYVDATLAAVFVLVVVAP